MTQRHAVARIPLDRDELVIRVIDGGKIDVRMWTPTPKINLRQETADFSQDHVAANRQDMTPFHALPCNHIGAMRIDETILGGAKRGRVRPRGFIEWRPQASTLALLEQIKAVLAEYADHLPLTLRQVFYRLVGAYGYDKTERAYGNLGETLNLARRARVIDMDTIRDDGLIKREPHSYADVDDFKAAVRNAAQS